MEEKLNGTTMVHHTQQLLLFLKNRRRVEASSSWRTEEERRHHDSRHQTPSSSCTLCWYNSSTASSCITSAATSGNTPAADLLPHQMHLKYVQQNNFNEGRWKNVAFIFLSFWYYYNKTGVSTICFSGPSLYTPRKEGRMGEGFALPLFLILRQQLSQQGTPSFPPPPSPPDVPAHEKYM